MATEGEWPKIDGDVLYASEVNFIGIPIKEVYTGTGFNSSEAATNVDEQDYELTAIPSTGLASATYAFITITGNAAVLIGNVQLKAQIKETGEAYADISAYTTVLTVPSGAGGFTNTVVLKIIATLTAGMKTNGFQIKLFSKSTGTSTAPDSAVNFSNINTVLEVRA